jgi:hypothetical protein
MVPTNEALPSAPGTNICSQMNQTEEDFERLKRLAATRGRSARARDPWEVVDEAAYWYLLGCYLGDGHVTHRPPGGWTLRVASDQQYESIIEEILAAMDTTFPGGRARGLPPRYFFTNHSGDIRRIFTEQCELLGIRVTQPNHRNPAISHRRSVAILEELVGPKS